MEVSKVVCSLLVTMLSYNEGATLQQHSHVRTWLDGDYYTDAQCEAMVMVYRLWSICIDLVRFGVIIQ